MSFLAYVALASDRPGADRVTLVLAGIGGCLACLAMIIRWRRFDTLGSCFQDPSANLGVLAKLVGCFSAGLLPAALHAGSWWSALLSFLVLIAIGLWLGYRHVVWAWYLAPAAVLLYVLRNVAIALVMMLGSAPVTPYGQGHIMGTLVMAPLWLYLALKLFRELRAWQGRMADAARDFRARGG